MPNRDRPVLNPDALAFVTDRHLATLSTLRADGTPHTVAIAFTYDPATGLARVITSGHTQKARNAARGGYAALTQVDGALWLTLEGPARVVTDAEAVRDAEARYAVRYKPPRENPQRVVIEIEVTRVLGSSTLRA
ncbi:PPOX class F420-dependent enzyme [Tsukamurella pulmonis]|uniref:pyridoxamine 5'-phosphate oxidase family protein n=1 Tax=Tsukamurella pulmonis TaxID=47312 RepID=UPI001EDE37FA|nr:TIGR03618 family F420-dependent PPOX class oxidoreductase [Tsukamurella pulmonis]BDD82641.1 PPOX class F420-dependent enzyme [Tsukamurella pulmonis]